MVPIVEPDAMQNDKRKGKNLFWKEAKICLAHAEGSKSPSYGGTLQGDVDTAEAPSFWSVPTAPASTARPMFTA